MKFLFLVSLSFFSLISLSAQWQPTNGPYEQVSATDVSSYKNMIILSAECGIYTKTNGDVWRARGGRSSYQLVVDSTLYLYGSMGWFTVDLEDPDFNIQQQSNKSMTAMARKDDRIFFASHEGLNYTTTAGQPLYPYNKGLPLDTISGPNMPTTYRLLVSDVSVGDDYMFVATEKGIFRSDFTYTKWEAKNTGLPSGYYSRVENFGAEVFALRRDSVYSSTDTGDTWRLLFQAPSVVTSINKYQGDLYITTGNHGILRSVDQGQTWQSLNAGFLVGSIWSGALFTKEINSQLYAGSTHEGLYVLDSSTWKPVGRKGMLCNEPVAMERVGPNLIYSGEYNLFRKTSYGWERFSPFPGRRFWYQGLEVKGNTVYASVAEFTSGYVDSVLVLYSNDAGQSWREFASMVPDASVFSYDQRIFAADSGLFVNTFQTLWHTSDSGKTWQDVNLPMNLCSEVEDVTIFQGEVYVLTCRSGTVYRQKNDGSWQLLYAGLAGAGDLEKFVQRDNVLMVSSRTALYTLVDGQQLWTQAGSGLASALVADYINAPDRIYACGFYGVYYSEDHGENWLPYNNDLPTTNSSAIDVFQDTLYVATGSGVYKHALFPQSVRLSENSSTQKFRVFPNPAYDQIRVEAQDRESVRYELYDARGRLAQKGEVLNGQSVSLKNISPGIYILWLRAGEDVYSEKLILK